MHPVCVKLTTTDFGQNTQLHKNGGRSGGRFLQSPHLIIQPQDQHAEQYAGCNEQWIKEPAGGKRKADQNSGNDEAGISDQLAVVVGKSEGNHQQEDIEEDQKGEELVVEHLVDVRQLLDFAQVEALHFIHPVGQAIQGQPEQQGRQNDGNGFLDDYKLIHIGGYLELWPLPAQPVEPVDEQKQ